MNARRLVLVGGALATIVLACQEDRPEVVRRFDPLRLGSQTDLRVRKAAQFESEGRVEAFHEFAFTDERERSGITFRHRVVRDASKTYKAVHYDHGNSLSVADVDGDGHDDLYFVNQAGPNELWRNRGDGTFEDITEEAGVSTPHVISVAASFADIDNDGDPDLYVTVLRDGNKLYLNDGVGHFRDVTAVSGLGYRGHPSGALFFDYDRDGELDLFLAVVGEYTGESIQVGPSESDLPEGQSYEFYDGFPDAFSGHLKEERFEPSRLFHNEGDGRFVDVTEASGLIDMSFSGDATPIDGNGDGWLDLYILDMQGDDEYYENQNGKTFVRKTDDVFPITPWGSMGVKVFDFNRDGLNDIFVTDMHSDMTAPSEFGSEKLKASTTYPLKFLNNGAYANNIYGNALFVRSANGSFEEVSDRTGAETYWPWGFSVGDLNADGFLDVFITASMNYPFRYGVNSLLLNERGQAFADAEFLLGVEPRRNDRKAQAWFTVDCSGADRHVEQLEKYCLTEDGLVEVWGALGSRSSVILDLEGDGDLDIVTNDFHGRPMVLVSNLAQTAGINYLEVELIGSESNRDGLGTSVRVVTAGGTQMQTKDGVSGYLSHSLQPLYFGLGADTIVERVEISWPSGRQQIVSGPVTANRRIEIHEGEDPELTR